MTSTTPSSPTEHPAVARWRGEQRNPRVFGEKVLVFAFVVAAPLVLFPWAWLLEIQRHSPLLSYAPVAWVVGCVVVWLLLSTARGLAAAFLAGSFALALSIAGVLALLLVMASFLFIPFAAFAVFPCVAMWVLARPTRTLWRAASGGTRPIASWCALLCGSVLPIVVCGVSHARILSRGDEYLVALQSNDAARIEHAAERFRPFAPWIGIERRAIGDRELGMLSIDSSGSNELGALARELDRARSPFRRNP